MRDYDILALNPGSTSTKIALFHNERMVFVEKVIHEAEELKQFADVNDQLPYRRNMILDALAKHGYKVDEIDAFVGRGGGLMPCEGGTFYVNDLMLEHAKNGTRGRHPAVLGTQLAAEFAAIGKGQAFMVDSPDADEMERVARITGIRGIYRQSRFHTLNHKRTGIIAAREMGGTYENMNFVIAHLGGGVSVAAHQKGRAIDATDHLGGDSPMAPTRSGCVPAGGIIDMCFSGKYTCKEMHEKLMKTGGLVELMGTSEMKDVSMLCEKGDEKAFLVREVLIYQIAKHIGAMAAVLSGKVDAVLLTGGIAYDTYITKEIERRVSFIAPVRIYPGEFEMEAMGEGALRVLRGEEKAKEYTGVPPYQADRIFGGDYAGSV